MTDLEELVKLADNERALFDAADRAYFKAGDTSDPQDWLQAGLLAQQHRNALIALRRLASSDGGMKVRELEWEAAGGDGTMSFRATAIGLRYYVYRNADDGFWHSYIEGYHPARFASTRNLDAAKAAAQADYEARIKSALVEVPAVKDEPEPVAWRYIVKQPDERPLPTYGQIPWAQLGRDVNDATFGRRADFEFSDKVYPGHQMVLGINFNSLARIVDKYRYYGLPCEANPTVAPPADAGMREALADLTDAFLSRHGCFPSDQTNDKERHWRRAMTRAYELVGQPNTPERQAALTAPGATTKSDGGGESRPASASGSGPLPVAHGETEEACSAIEPSNGVTSDGRQQEQKRTAGVAPGPSDPSSTRSDVTDMLSRVLEMYFPRNKKHPPLIQEARTLLDQFEIRRNCP